jgi:hypothetical protein
MANCKNKNKHISLSKESNNDWIGRDKITQIYEEKAKALTLKEFPQFKFKNYYFDALLNGCNIVTAFDVIYRLNNTKTWTED